MAITFMSIIILSVNRLNSPTKGGGWLSGYQTRSISLSTRALNLRDTYRPQKNPDKTCNHTTDWTLRGWKGIHSKSD